MAAPIAKEVGIFPVGTEDARGFWPTQQKLGDPASCGGAALNTCCLATLQQDIAARWPTYKFVRSQRAWFHLATNITFCCKVNPSFCALVACVHRPCGALLLLRLV